MTLFYRLRVTEKKNDLKMKGFFIVPFAFSLFKFGIFYRRLIMRKKDFKGATKLYFTHYTFIFMRNL